MAKYRDSSDEEMPMDFDPFAKRKNLTKEERMYGVWADETEKKRENDAREAKNEKQDDSSDDDALHCGSERAIARSPSPPSASLSRPIDDG